VLRSYVGVLFVLNVLKSAQTVRAQPLRTLPAMSPLKDRFSWPLSGRRHVPWPNALANCSDLPLPFS